MGKKLNPFVFASTLALVLIILLQLLLILWLQPGYGVGDDGTLLNFCDATQSEGLAKSYAKFISDDITWGMYRPAYFFMSQVLYCTTQTNPTLLYFWNAIFVFALLGFFAWTIFDALPLSTWPRALFIPVSLLLTISFYRTHDLFMTVALQEKLVLLAAAFSMLVCARSSSEKKTKNKILWQTLEIFCLIFCLILGLASKAHFLTFLPGLFLLLLSNYWRAPAKSLHLAKIMVFLVISLGGMILIQKIARQGTYTSKYSISHVLENIFTRQAIFLLLLGVLSAVIEARRIRQSKGKLPDLANALVPATFLFSFVAIMSPWSIGDFYVLAVITPLCAYCILSLAQPLAIEKVGIPLFLVIALAISLTAYRGYRNFGRYGDLRKILYSEEFSRLLDAPHLVVMPCEEGAYLIRIYVRRHSGKILNSTDKWGGALPSDKNSYLLADSALCQASPQILAQAQPISQPRFSGSFTLYRLSPKGSN